MFPLKNLARKGLMGYNKQTLKVLPYYPVWTMESETPGKDHPAAAGVGTQQCHLWKRKIFSLFSCSEKAQMKHIKADLATYIHLRENSYQWSGKYFTYPYMLSAKL